MVIMVIGNSIARAFALVGALSIIRFRTVIKIQKILYIFWSLAAGMATGTGIILLHLQEQLLSLAFIVQNKLWINL